MTELRKVREEREHFIRGGSLQAIGKAVDDFIATPLDDGWLVRGVDVDAHIQNMGTMQNGVIRTSAGFTATIHTVRTDVYGRHP